MADEPILGLFDSDTNFLDELTGSAADLGGVMSTEGDGMLGQTMQPLGTTPQMGPDPTSQMPPGPTPQNSMMMMQPTPQGPPAGYQQMGPDSYGAMAAGGAAPGPQVSSQYSPADPAYSQYAAMPKMATHHSDSMMTMGMGIQQPQQGGMSIMQQQQQQQQFGSPSAGGMMQQHSSYQRYNMPGGTMAAQQQPMSMMGQQQGLMAQQQGMMGQQQSMMGQQGSNWNPTQASPTSSHPQFMSPQSQQQGCMTQSMGQGFMGQHDYGMQQNMGHYGDNSYMQQQASPMASPGGMNMMGGPLQRQSHPQFQAQAPVRQPNPAMASYGIQPGQRYPGDYMAQRPGMNPVAPPQRYPYPQNSAPSPQAMAADGTPVGHFSQNQASSYMPSYPGTSHATATPSPHPSTVSQSMAGSHSMTMGQGSYCQSSLQELEQLVSPTLSSGGGMPSTNPYQQIMQSSCTSASSMTPHSPIYSSASFPTTTVPSSPAPIQTSPSMGMGSAGPLSPNPAMRQGVGPQSGVNMEIQRLEKQIQHLFNMPQTQQISQQMLDMQERLRILKAQQQQQIMQMQRQQQQQQQHLHQQQQQQMHMNSPTRLGGKPGFGQQHPGMGQQRPRMPGPISTPAQSPMSSMGPMGPGSTGSLLGATGQTSQLQVQGQHPGQQISPQRPPSQSTPISSPQRIQPFQSPTSSTPGDGLSAPTPPSQPMVVQQAADSMTDPVQMTPPTLHSTPVLDRRPDADHTKVISSDPLPATVTEIAEAQEGQGEKPKRKRERKPKGDKQPKEPKVKKPRTPKTPKEPKPPKPPKEPKAPKTPRTPKTPKTPKEPKEKKTRVRKSKKTKEETNESVGSDLNVTASEIDVEKVDSSDPTLPTTTMEVEEGKEEVLPEQQTTPKKRTPREKKPRTPKTVVKALKKPSTKKRKPPASLFLKKRKRKRTGSDGSDVEMTITPPGSPAAGDHPNKRRSARHTNKRKKYLDDIDLNLSDDEGTMLEPLEGTDGPVAMKTETEEDALIVEKILGHRIRKKDAEEEGAEAEEEEFLVKYKNYSFLHCEWRTVAEIGDKRIHSKIKRYKLKKLQTAFFDEPEDEEYFNPDYVEVDRVLDMVTSKDPVTGDEVTHYLVKWRALSYEESTWELQQDVDPRKVQLFKDLRVPPPEEERQVLARPKPSQWRKQEDIRVYKGDNTLREYQLEGLNWLTFCWHNGQNCILADEMGLGKTIQSITFLNEIYQYGIKGPFLIIVPLSTIGNWQREFETWTDMNAVVYHGTSNSRSLIQEYELFYKDENGQRLPETFKFDALITTYEIIIADVELLTSIEWRCCIIDEAHRLKNKNCRLLEGLRLFDIEHRVLLTGTPLQNNTEELFSLLNFLNPGKFSSATAFAKEFGDLKTEAQVDKLKEILKPMMLRRLKEDVEKNLAPKEETIIEVELTNIQKKYYRAILERNFQFLSKGGTTNMPSLMNTMMELRKCCNHPYLINGAEEQIVNEQGARGDHEQLLAALVGSSGKMVLMDKLLPRLKQDGHKVLIFSQMIRVLDIIEDYLMQKKYLFERLDGRIRGNLRQEAIDRFSKPDSDRFVFLLCTRAGGLGINLTAADTVIIYDSDWNPQNDLQAQARCHRIGQSKAVKVYRLITRNSYEREMFDKASLKLGLDKAVLQSMGGEKGINTASQMSKKEVEDLLKKGAYGALMEDDNAGDKFCEEDIDIILQRRTKVIQIESEGKGSTFAKASFSVSDNRTDIDINDPNFWQKWAKKADLDVDMMANKNDLIIQAPRQRRQTSRYGKEEAVMDISDLESSSDSDDEMKLLRKGRKTRRSGRGNDDDFMCTEGISSEGYTRSDCFKVEKHLLIYGWGRWQDIIKHAHFKHTLVESDVQIIARAILAHSLKFYKGDERIKEFIWDLIANNNEGELKNHMGLSAPVPRGRKGKKAKEKKVAVEEGRPLDFDPEAVLDNGYKRHLHRHSNKVLLRVRLLYYIKQEVIGDEAAKVFEGARCHEVNIPPPISDGEIPAPWWDECADRCLLIGVFKHGYEKFNQVRQDPALCFLTRCGPPDGAALLAEQNEDKEEEEELEAKLMEEEGEGDASQSSAPDTTTSSHPISVQTDESGEGKFQFPSGSDLNVRLRRVITGYQRNHKKMMLKQEQFARKMERREQAQMMVSERVSKKKEFQQSRWSRREEADFYRTVSTFGVEFDRDSGRFKWDRFRSLARLERKYDETITEYFHAFYYMCQTVCGKFRSDDRVPPPPNGIFVEPITEERASRCLARIDLLNKIRDDILPHPKLEERLKLCQPSFDMPPWWQCGKHDKELLIGAARHGVARTDFNILRDPTLTFHEVLKNSGRHLRSTPQHSQNSQPCAASPLSSAPPSSLHLSPAVAADLREDDLESDAKSQDSMDLHDSRASSPPPLHNGKVQYPHPHTDADWEGGPPKLELAISPSTGQEAECKLADVAREDGAGVAVSPADTIEAAEENKCQSSPPCSPQPPPSPLKSKPACSSSDENNGKNGAAKEAGETVQTQKAEPSCKDSDRPESGGGAVPKLQAKVEDADVPSLCPHPDTLLEERGEGAGASEELKASPESEVQEAEPEKTVKVEKDDGCRSPTGASQLQKAEDVTVGAVEEEAVGCGSAGQTTDVKEEKAAVKLEGSSTGKGDDGTPGKGEKPDYVKLKEKIIQGEMERLQREKLLKEGVVSTAVGVDGLSPMAPAFPGLYGEDSPYLDAEGLEPGEIVPGRPFLGPAIEWPKDRVIFHRLEHICYTVEHGEWPFARRPPSFLQTTPYDSRSATPVGGSTPRPDSASESGEAAELNQVMHPLGGDQSQKDFEVRLSQNEGLKMTFHKRGRGRGRGGSSRYEIDAEKAARVQQLLNQSAQAMGSSDSESQPEPVNLSTPLSTASHQSSPALSAAVSTSLTESPVNGSPMSDIEQLQQSMMEQGYVFPERRRRGRKRKAEKLAEQAMAEALAKREQARILSSLDPETRVPVVNMNDGSMLCGDEAPKKRRLEQWLLEHPGYMISGQAASGLPLPGAVPEEQPPPPLPDLQAAQVAERRKPGRKPKLDPRMLHEQRLTGEENVSVVERGSGRKITGAKAPPLKHLKEWLEQNPTFDVDPKWGELLRAKGSLPPSMDARLLKPSGRGRKPRNAGPLHSMMSSAADFPLHASMAGLAGFPAAAGLMAGGFPKFPLGMPFANLAGLGMTNPMLGLAAAAAGFPLAGFPVPGATSKDAEEGKEGGSKDKTPASTSTATSATPDSGTTSSTSSASPHPSFPGFFFNPMAFNPLLAGQLRNFPMPGFPSLAHMAALNGLPEGGADEEEFLAASARKEKKSSHSLSKSEKGQDLTKVVEKIKDMSRSGAPSMSSQKSSTAIQDMTMKGAKDSSPSPAHSKGSKPSSTATTPTQDQATDLSIRAKPSPSMALTTPSAKSKNKIHKSFSLNRIVDSLKEKIEEKSKKKDDGPDKERESSVHKPVKNPTPHLACQAKDADRLLQSEKAGQDEMKDTNKTQSEKNGQDDVKAKVSVTSQSEKVIENSQPEKSGENDVKVRIIDNSQPEKSGQDDVKAKVSCISQPEKSGEEDAKAKVSCISQPEKSGQEDGKAKVSCISQPEKSGQDDGKAKVSDISQPEMSGQDDVKAKVSEISQPEMSEQDDVKNTDNSQSEKTGQDVVKIRVSDSSQSEKIQQDDIKDTGRLPPEKSGQDDVTAKVSNMMRSEEDMDKWQSEKSGQDDVTAKVSDKSQSEEDTDNLQPEKSGHEDVTAKVCDKSQSEKDTNKSQSEKDTDKLQSEKSGQDDVKTKVPNNLQQESSSYDTHEKAATENHKAEPSKPDSLLAVGEVLESDGGSNSQQMCSSEKPSKKEEEKLCQEEEKSCQEGKLCQEEVSS